jgi:hypothetical protein
MEDKNVHFIALITPKKGGNSPFKIKEKYDYVINSSVYSDKKDNDKISDQIKKNNAYELLYKYINKIKLEKICTISEDIKLSEITSLSYSDLTQNKEKNLKIIYVCNDPCIFNYTNPNMEIIYLGIDETLINDELFEKIKNNEKNSYYTIKKIKQIGIEKILSLITKTETEDMHLIIDMRIIDKFNAVSVVRDIRQSEFLLISDIEKLCEYFNNKINYLDILGFNDDVDDPISKSSKITGDVARYVIKNTYSLPENKLNIFNEYSKFLIYRPVKQTNEKDYGWYILRNMTLDERDEIIKKLGDKIGFLTISDYDHIEKKHYKIDVYVAVTTMSEQEKNVYYAASEISEKCLFPAEKVSMAFALINTEKPKNNKKKLKIK